MKKVNKMMHFSRVTLYKAIMLGHEKKNKLMERKYKIEEELQKLKQKNESFGKSNC